LRTKIEGRERKLEATWQRFGCTYNPPQVLLCMAVAIPGHGIAIGCCGMNVFFLSFLSITCI
jgi:hypothetical protein